MNRTAAVIAISATVVVSGLAACGNKEDQNTVTSTVTQTEATTKAPAPPPSTETVTETTKTEVTQPGG